jgi:hypothetical protein
MIALSVRSCAINRSRPAPIARRTDSSRCRDAARASVKLAALAQAIRKISPTAAIKTYSGSVKRARWRNWPRPAGSNTIVS